MINQQVNNHRIFVQGFENVNLPNPKATIEKLRKQLPEMQIQIVKANMVAGIEHVLLASKNAIRTYHSQGRRSKSLAIEFLLHLSGRRQISESLSLLGVDPTDKDIVLVGLSNSSTNLDHLKEISHSILRGNFNDKLLEINSQSKLERLKTAFQISEKELQAVDLHGEDKTDALKRLVIERSALLNVEG